MKKLADLTPYTNTLPFDSEVFGVYQPLLGWRSKRTVSRIAKGFARDIGSIYKRLRPHFEIAVERDQVRAVSRVEPATIDAVESPSTRSFVLEAIMGSLPPLERYQDDVWDRIALRDHVQQVLTSTVPKITDWYMSDRSTDVASRGDSDSQAALKMVVEQVNRESAVAGYLLFLAEHKQYEKLKNIFYKQRTDVTRLVQLLAYRDPLEMIDPFHDLQRVSLSPIGIVHLFRQYFFELDTFLGTPVNHVWLSPGAEVELLEISTRREYIERTFEQSFESITKTEKTTTDQDELSTAVKDDNKSNLKLGASATANQSWIGGSASATTTLDMDKTQEKAREETHRHMREQTEKLSSEIRRSYKSTFKQVTEKTDTSSKRYLLKNATEKLINYELRRKMRQVAVQVQDIGTYLCWQTFVDDPGRQLGIARLVHVAKDPETGGAPPPEAIPIPQPIVTQLPIDLPFVQLSEDRGDLDEGYENGAEVDEDFNEGAIETIQAVFPGFTATCEQSGYELAHLDFDAQGNDVQLSVVDLVPADGSVSFGINLDYVNFRGNSPIRVMANVTWRPKQTWLDEIHAKNRANMAKYTERTQFEYQKAFTEAARERIKLASNIAPRKYEDLREEERIVVYRRLVQDMLTRDLPIPDDRTRHVVSELLDTIFDVDKMLYFVAPEWWRPRLHESHQALGGIRTPSSVSRPSVFDSVRTATNKHRITTAVAVPANREIGSIDTVTWGGEKRADDYYITEESLPAKLGSSLGWLLQLDGDDMRNAFLNAPWVKAVLPIRPGQERAAINWLQRLHVEGAEGLDDQYIAPPDQLASIPHDGATVKVRDAVQHLCDVVKAKHEQALKVARYPTDEIHDDNRVSATPIDRVYEHGFYPLQGGFRALTGTEGFEVFDQWIEVLPTDQIVPVEVTYDPKSGRQL
ncbi:MAG: peptidoglycan-binding protein [Kofleriaceae bacterium]